ncbi:hypothetical protein [Methylobacterium sp. SD21]|uniref:hypothetical protein n=1 Tax=Methylobacterium litchii TaxID=3138810 RepID=UPI00313EF081
MDQQDNTIRLEGRYISSGQAVTDPLNLECEWVDYRQPEFKDVKAPDGTIKQRSVTTQPSLVATGLPNNFVQEKGDWTHIVSPALPHGEGELVQIMPLGNGRARFFVRYRE